MGSLTTVEFRGDTLFAVERDDGVFVAVKPISDRLGLNWNGQVQRMKRDPILREGTCVIHVPSPGGVQETACLALRHLNGWLFGIDSSRVKPELRERVLAYQRECYDVLADHFLGPRGGARAIRVPEGAHDTEMRLREWHEKMVGRAERIFGKAAARATWLEFGYTDHSHLMPSGGKALPVEVEDLDPAEAIAAVRDFLHANRKGGLVDTMRAGDPGTWLKRGVVGFVARNGLLYLHEAGWRQATDGLDGAAVADVLHEVGFLVRSTEGRRKAVVRVNGRPMRAYCLRPQILDAE